MFVHFWLSREAFFFKEYVGKTEIHYAMLLNRQIDIQSYSCSEEDEKKYSGGG
jgi:hypothetical protein